LALDQVRWIPAGEPWQKSRAVTASVHREAMVRLAIEGEAGFVVDRRELQRGGPSYTIDTVRECQAAKPGCEWVLLIGHDQYVGLHTWRDWQALLASVTLAVANRPGVVAQPDPEVLRFPHHAVPLPMLDISSTEVRRRVSRGETIAELVPPAVARYIDHHHLYRKDAAAH
jgi:nicotinate-nucleotide adenylyltransferase